MRSIPIVALIAAFTLLAGCSTPKTAQNRPDVTEAATPPGVIKLTEQMEQRAQIRVETANKRKLSGDILFSATVEAPTSTSGAVTAPVAGTVTRILADVGQSVRRGQTVAYISSPDITDMQANYLNAGARVQEAQAQVELAKGRVALAQADLNRETVLTEKGISSVRERQLAEGRLNSAQSELSAARTMIKAAQSSQAATRVRLTALRITAGGAITAELPLKSPVDGVVIERTVEPGQTISPATAASAGDHGHLFRIANLSKVWVMLEVPQSEVSSIKLGAPVSFTSEVAPGERFTGRVVRLGEKFDEQTRTVGVRVAINNPKGRLKPGVLVLARAVEGGSANPVLSVPSSAIQQVDGKEVVFIRTAPHTYRLQPVRLGERLPRYTEVLSGLPAGSAVVSSGSFVLKSEALKASLGGG